MKIKENANQTSKYVYGFNSNELNKHKSVLKNLELPVYAVLALFIPFILGHLPGLPLQLIVGSIINALLIFTALNFNFKKTLPIIILPSIGAFLSGLIFGPVTYALFYLIPFIWIGNSILVMTLQKFNQLNKNYFISMFTASSLKSGFLFVSALILYTLNLIPAQFLLAMGLFQFLTALIGAGIAFIPFRLRR